MTGASADALGADTVTEALISVGFPHDGQNFFELSLHNLKIPGQNGRRKHITEGSYLKQA